MCEYVQSSCTCVGTFACVCIFFGRSAYLHYLKVNHIFAQRATLLYTIFFSLLFFVGFSICQSEVVVILYHFAVLYCIEIDLMSHLLVT